MIALSSDHAGFPLKEAIKEYFIENNIEFEHISIFRNSAFGKIHLWHSRRGYHLSGSQVP